MKQSEDGDLRLWELAQVLWSGKWILLLVTVFSAVGAVAGSFLVEKQFQATILVSPVSRNSAGLGSGAGALASLGGVAALMGINLGGDVSTSEAIATLESSTLTEQFIEKNNLLHVLFREAWNGKEGKWKESKGKTPTLWAGTVFFNKTVRRVLVDNKTGLITVRVTWSDADTAAAWASGIVELANTRMREAAIAESGRNIEYLNQEVVKTNVVEIRQGIYSLLQTEINKQMLARGAKEYAFKVIDEARPPEERTYPNRRVWGLMGLVLGGISGVILVLIRAAIPHRAPSA